MGTLDIVATPIGNLEDITIRAIKTLFSVDIIACEDTRRTGQLLEALKNKFTFMVRLVKASSPKLISYYDEVEENKIPQIINLLENDKNVALVSDSGTPLISDPGFKLVRECIKRGIKVTSIPGPSSVITALTISGLSTNQFLFLGYLPLTQNKRKKILTQLQHRYGSSHSEVVKAIHPTVIFFETPHRLKESLKDLKEVFGDIEIVIARELTKIHEEIYRGKISQATAYFSKIKGELVVLFNLS